MKAVDYILEGVERELALERLLGTRTVEIDRSLLIRPEGLVTELADGAPNMLFDEQQAFGSSPTPITPPSEPQKLYDFVFLHDKQLSNGALEIMTKIIGALKTNEQLSPIIFTGTLPKARAYVALGEMALRKWFPTTSGSFNTWLITSNHEQVLFTRSPEFFLRFPVVTKEVKAMKNAMWNCLKGIRSRIDNVG